MLLLLLTSLPPYFLASSFHESQVTKSPVVHPLSVQLVTKCFSRNSFVLKMIHLSWGCTPLNEEIMNSTITNSSSTVSPSQTSRMRVHFGIFADNRWRERRKESVQYCTDPRPRRH